MPTGKRLSPVSLLINDHIFPNHLSSYSKLYCCSRIMLQNNEHLLMKKSKDMNGASKLVYYVVYIRNVGLPKGRESYGNGVPIVVRVRESLIQGEGEQVRYLLWKRRKARCLKLQST